MTNRQQGGTSACAINAVKLACFNRYDAGRARDIDDGRPSILPSPFLRRGRLQKRMYQLESWMA